jgi:hypothetical protein
MSFGPSPSPQEIELMGQGRQERMLEEAAKREMVEEAMRDSDDSDSKRQSGLPRLLARLRRGGR